MRNPLFSRRDFLLLAGTAACVKAADKDFWNSKPPSEWETGEIYSLMNNSPWARTVKWRGPRTPGDTNSSAQTSVLKGGGDIIGHAQVGKMPQEGPKAVITWESAPPVRDAMKTPPAPVYANFYVIGVDTIPNAEDYYYLEEYAHLRCVVSLRWTCVKSPARSW